MGVLVEYRVQADARSRDLIPDQVVLNDVGLTPKNPDAAGSPDAFDGVVSEGQALALGPSAGETRGPTGQAIVTVSADVAVFHGAVAASLGQVDAVRKGVPEAAVPDGGPMGKVVRLPGVVPTGPDSALGLFRPDILDQGVGGKPPLDGLVAIRGGVAAFLGSFHVKVPQLDVGPASLDAPRSLRSGRGEKDLRVPHARPLEGGVGEEGQLLVDPVGSRGNVDAFPGCRRRADAGLEGRSVVVGVGTVGAVGGDVEIGGGQVGGSERRARFRFENVDPDGDIVSAVPPELQGVAGLDRGTQLDAGLVVALQGGASGPGTVVFVHLAIEIDPGLGGGQADFLAGDGPVGGGDAQGHRPAGTVRHAVAQAEHVGGIRDRPFGGSPASVEQDAAPFLGFRGDVGGALGVGGGDFGGGGNQGLAVILVIADPGNLHAVDHRRGDPELGGGGNITDRHGGSGSAGDACQRVGTARIQETERSAAGFPEESLAGVGGIGKGGRDRSGPGGSPEGGARGAVDDPAEVGVGGALEEPLAGRGCPRIGGGHAGRSVGGGLEIAAVAGVADPEVDGGRGQKSRGVRSGGGIGQHQGVEVAQGSVGSAEAQVQRPGGGGLEVRNHCDLVPVVLGNIRGVLHVEIGGSGGLGEGGIAVNLVGCRGVGRIFVGAEKGQLVGEGGIKSAQDQPSVGGVNVVKTGFPNSQGPQSRRIQVGEEKVGRKVGGIRWSGWTVKAVRANPADRDKTQTDRSGDVGGIPKGDGIGVQRCQSVPVVAIGVGIGSVDTPKRRGGSKIDQIISGLKRRGKRVGAGNQHQNFLEAFHQGKSSR